MMGNITPTNIELQCMYVLNWTIEDILKNRKLQEDELKLKNRIETIKRILK